MKKQITSIKEISALSGVSIATVSRILNNKGGYSEAIKQKVLDICEENNFTLNQTAVSLKTRKSNLIGLILPNIQNPFYARMASLIEQQLSEYGYFTLICDSANNSAKEKQYFQTLISKGVDGILCVSGLHYIDKNILTRNIPVVLIDRDVDNEFALPVVKNNEVETTANITNVLLDLGCRNILLINGFTNEYNKEDRIRGFRQELEKHHIPWNDEYIVRREGKDASHIETEILVNQFLEKDLPLDGVLATSERSALGALTALKSKGLRVPEDVKVVSYDNTICSILTTPTLSSVERNSEMAAKEACRLLFDIINEKNDHKGEVIQIPTELIHRQSTRKLK